MTTLNILGISGSLRSKSYNQFALAAAAQVMAELSTRQHEAGNITELALVGERAARAEAREHDRAPALELDDLRLDRVAIVERAHDHVAAWAQLTGQEHTAAPLDLGEPEEALRALARAEAIATRTVGGVAMPGASSR